MTFDQIVVSHQLSNLLITETILPIGTNSLLLFFIVLLKIIQSWKNSTYPYIQLLDMFKKKQLNKFVYLV